MGSEEGSVVLCDPDQLPYRCDPVASDSFSSDGPSGSAWVSDGFRLASVSASASQTPTVSPDGVGLEMWNQVSYLLFGQDSYLRGISRNTYEYTFDLTSPATLRLNGLFDVSGDAIYAYVQVAGWELSLRRYLPVDQTFLLGVGRYTLAVSSTVEVSTSINVCDCYEFSHLKLDATFRDLAQEVPEPSTLLTGGVLTLIGLLVWRPKIARAGW